MTANRTQILDEAAASLGLLKAVPGSLQTRPQGLAGRVVMRLGTLIRALIHRRQVLDMAGMDERMLKDIGLSRTDVVSALDGAWHRDPSQALIQRAREHQAQTWRHVRQGYKAHPSADAHSSEKLIKNIRHAA